MRDIPLRLLHSAEKESVGVSSEKKLDETQRHSDEAMAGPAAGMTAETGGQDADEAGTSGAGEVSATAGDDADGTLDRVRSTGGTGDMGPDPATG